MKRSPGAIKQSAVALCQIRIVVFAVLPVTSLHADDATRPAVILTPEAAAIHSAGMLFDGHNDLPWEVREKGNSSFDTSGYLQTAADRSTPTLPRLRKGGLKAQFWSVYVPAEHDKTGDAPAADSASDFHRQVDDAAIPRDFEFASTADDIERIVKSGRSLR
jgi:membrane dipeptidase